MATTSLFNIGLDDRVADCPANPGFDTGMLLGHFGPDVTWRTVLKADLQEIYGIKGFGRQMVNRLYAFISENVEYSFSDLV